MDLIFWCPVLLPICPICSLIFWSRSCAVTLVMLQAYWSHTRHINRLTSNKLQSPEYLASLNRKRRFNRKRDLFVPIQGSLSGAVVHAFRWHGTPESFYLCFSTLTDPNLWDMPSKCKMIDSIYLMDNEERENLLWFQNIYMKRQLTTVYRTNSALYTKCLTGKWTHLQKQTIF